MARTLYDVLGIPKSAAPSEVKRSFRRLAKRYHPDVNGSREGAERFLEIQEAYHVLSNPLLRRDYDEKLDPQASVGSEPRSPISGPGHKVKVPRGYVDVRGPFPPAHRSDGSKTSADPRRRFAGKIWIAYTVVAITMAAATFGLAIYLAAAGFELQAAVTASGGGMMLGLLLLSWFAKRVAAPEL